MDLKNSFTSPQFSHTSETVHECDTHWSKGSSNVQSQQTTSSSDQQLPSGASRKASRNEGLFHLDEAQVIQIAIEAFVRELGLEDDSVLRDGKVQIRDVPAGTYLMKEESHKVKWNKLNCLLILKTQLNLMDHLFNDFFFIGRCFSLCRDGISCYQSTCNGRC